MYGVISNNAADTTEVSIYIDGQLYGSYSHTPTGAGGLVYHVLLYGSDSIPNGKHSFALQNGHAGGTPSLVLFDYLQYTT